MCVEVDGRIAPEWSATLTQSDNVRVARQPATTGANGRMEGCERQNWLEARRHANGVASG